MLFVMVQPLMYPEVCENSPLRTTIELLHWAVGRSVLEVNGTSSADEQVFHKRLLCRLGFWTVYTRSQHGLE